jgi:hypothetical protein
MLLLNSISWVALNHAIAVNKLLGDKDRVAMTNCKGHSPTRESNAQIVEFCERFLKPAGKRADARR